MVDSGRVKEKRYSSETHMEVGVNMCVIKCGIYTQRRGLVYSGV